MSLTALKAFSPVKASAVSAVPSATTQNLVLNTEPSVGPGGYNVRVVNNSTLITFIRFGGTGQTAALTDVPVVPGSVEVFGLRGGDTTVGLISTGAATGSIYFNVGEGV